MALPPHNPDYVPSGPNNKANPYYKRINTVRLARMDYNRSEFFGTVGGQPAVRELVLTYLGQDSRAARIPFPPAAFAAEGGVGPYMFDPGDGTEPIPVATLAAVNRYYYTTNGTFTATLTDTTGDVQTVEAVVDWIEEPPDQLVVTQLPPLGSDFALILIEAGEGPYTIDWGDGFVTESTLRLAFHRYAESGTWTVSVTDAVGSLEGAVSVTTVVTEPEPEPDALYEGQLTIGSLLTRRGTQIPDWGNLLPREWDIYRFDDLFIDNVDVSSVVTRCKFSSSVQVFAADFLKVTIGDQEPFTMEWTGSAFSTVYNAASAGPGVAVLDLWYWMNERVGTTVPIKVEAFLGPEPTFFGPFNAIDVIFWLRGTLAEPELGFNVDSDVEPDVWVSAKRKPRNVTREVWDIIKDKIQEVLS